MDSNTASTPEPTPLTDREWEFFIQGLVMGAGPQLALDTMCGDPDLRTKLASKIKGN